jgi:hypothetical protein
LVEKILFRLQLFSTEIPVFEVRSPLWGSRKGIYDRDEHSILLNADLGLDVLRLTLLRELVHAVGVLCGVKMPEALPDQTACVLLPMLRRSSGLLRWIRDGTTGEMEVRILTSRHRVEFLKSNLWTGECVSVDATRGEILVDSVAGTRDQQLSLISAVLAAGMEFLGGRIPLPARSAVSEAVVGLYTAPAEVTGWLRIEADDGRVIGG